ncbi:MAG: type IV pilus modification protein PilV [Betaproteobacteria bacterium]
MRIARIFAPNTAAASADHPFAGDASIVQCSHRDGFAMIEVLVTIVLLSIGLLGLAALQSRTAIAHVESYQRVQALLLAQDMADRIAANSANSARYAGDDFGSGAAVPCVGLISYELDRCAWSNMIRGTTERSGARDTGTLIAGRGCVVVGDAGRIDVVVVWQGMLPTTAPAALCGRNTFGTDSYRRAVVVPLRIARLTGA